MSRHLWGAITAEGDDFHVVEPRDIDVLDRIGGGDGFVGGMLHGVLKGWEPEKWVQFGWASGALVTTMLTDYAQPADEEQVRSISEGNARVKRQAAGCLLCSACAGKPRSAAGGGARRGATRGSSRSVDRPGPGP